MLSVQIKQGQYQHSEIEKHGKKCYRNIKNFGVLAGGHHVTAFQDSTIQNTAGVMGYSQIGRVQKAQKAHYNKAPDQPVG